MSSSGSIETMRGRNEKARRDHAIGNADPSNLVDAAESHVSRVGAHADRPPSDQDLDYNNQVLSDTSMASNSVPAQSRPAASVQLSSEFKTEYHPRSGHPTLFQPFDEFHVSLEAQQAPIDEKPWCPFRSHADFEFSEITLDAALNKSQIDALLDLILHVSQGHTEITLKNEADLSKAWDNAAAELTPFSKHEVPVTYKKNEQVYEITHYLHRTLSGMRACVYKRSATGFKRFFDEPWTGDRWWDIQSSLPPNIDGAMPLCFILYADKTRLSSHGTVKGYPVVVRCANLPVHIRNGEGFGGGRVVRWLPIVPEGAPSVTNSVLYGPPDGHNIPYKTGQRTMGPC
ncbi:hypothetical protein F4604DRAFT_1943800 [Suillus subluteus]|nr:hypothetical protein F4604DRAFT_1943800 [Suillus subluteus]